MAELLTASEVLKMTGATYRQLDYWAREGILPPSVRATGSGSRRGWSVEDARRIRALVVVSEALQTFWRSFPSGGPPWRLQWRAEDLDVEIAVRPRRGYRLPRAETLDTAPNA